MRNHPIRTFLFVLLADVFVFFLPSAAWTAEISFLRALVPSFFVTATDPANKLIPSGKTAERHVLDIIKHRKINSVGIPRKMVVKICQSQ